MWIEPDYVSLAGGQTYQFVIRIHDDDWNEVENANMVWSVTNEMADSINSETGLFTASWNRGYYPNVAKATSRRIYGIANVTILPAQRP